MTWASIMVGFAALLGLAILAHGLYTFKPHRARNVKYAEHAHDVAEHIIESQRHHPEIVKIGRLDRHYWFVGVHLCVLGYTSCVFAGANLTSNVAALGTGARYTMAVCFLVGSVLVLTGATLGATVGRWTINRNVSDHLTASVLGDDVALPYRLAMAGMGAMMVSSLIYSYTSFTSANGTPGSLGGWLTGGIGILCLLTIQQFYVAVARFQKWDAILIAEAKVRAGIGDG